MFCVYEQAQQCGGWLYYGIPSYRLPKDILQKEIELLCQNGMEIRTGIKVGTDISFNRNCLDSTMQYIWRSVRKMQYQCQSKGVN